jgi:midasin (ATPase involved in ribosome maturation)
MLARKGQGLPFDIREQRVIMSDRRPQNADGNRSVLGEFISAAKEGDFYKPMDAVHAYATLDIAASSPRSDELMKALIEAVNALQEKVQPAITTTVKTQERTNEQSRVTVGMALRKKALRKQVRKAFTAAGGTEQLWVQLLGHPLTEDEHKTMVKWGVAEWGGYVLRALSEKP